MRTRDAAGLSLAPLFLRFALALTFLWAGVGKFAATMPVEGEPAAILANYGVIPNPNSPATPAPETPDDAPAPEEQTETPGEATPENPLESDEPAETPDEDEPTEEARVDSVAGGAQAPPAMLVALQEAPSPTRARAEDFPEPVEVRRWAGLVLALHSAIHPGLDPETSEPRMQLWPDLDPATDYDPWPRYAAIAVALTEVGAGVLVAIGLLTRLGGLSLAGVMAGAMWLTVIGPAMQSGNTHLFVLPAHDPYDPEAWTKPLWQLSLLCSGLALAFIGPGSLSLDRLLLGGPRRRPAPPPPKPKN